MTDDRDDLDRLVGELTDVAVPRQLHANVMRGVTGSTPRRGLPWRVVVSGAAVILVAAIVWFGSGRSPRGTPPRTTASRLPAAGGAIALRGGAAAPHSLPAPRTGLPRRTGLAAVRRPAQPPKAAPLVVAAAERSAPERAAIPEIVLAPLPEPDPLEAAPIAVAPMVVEREEIPLLELAPVVPPETKGERR